MSPYAGRDQDCPRRRPEGDGLDQGRADGVGDHRRGPAPRIEQSAHDRHRVVEVIRGHLHAGGLADQPLFHHPQPSSVRGHEHVVFRHLHQVPCTHPGPQRSHRGEVRSGWGLLKDGDTEFDDLLRDLRRGRPGHRDDHEVGLALIGRLFDGAHRQGSEPARQLLAPRGRPRMDPGDGEPPGQLGGAPQEELRPPAGAHDRELRRSIRRGHLPASCRFVPPRPEGPEEY